ncbi:hypothetical protein AB1N83_009681 [Pleurotus pulmonarius]
MGSIYGDRRYQTSTQHALQRSWTSHICSVVKVLEQLEESTIRFVTPQRTHIGCKMYMCTVLDSATGPSYPPLRQD